MIKRPVLLKFSCYGLFLFFIILIASVMHADAVGSLTAANIAGPSGSPPGKLAAGNDLTLYVVESYKGVIRTFDGTARFVGTIAVDQPSAIAVGRDKTLYIGSHRDYSVGIYKNNKLAGYLGTGKNEFSSVLDIAVDDSTGDVYVADAGKNVIKVYSASGVPKASFSGFNAPVSVAVTGEDVYVLDAPVSGSSPGTGSRISVFAKSGSFRWSVDERGQNAEMQRPVDIAVDSMGAIFVADAGCSAVLVYDKRGVFTGRIAGEGLKRAVSLALTRDSRLYVSSSETNSIVEIGLKGIVHSAEKVSLDFQSKTGAGLEPAALGY